MSGPMPPNVGGMATVLGDLGASRLSSEVKLVFFNTAKTTREGRNLLEAIFSKLKLWSDWLRLLKAESNTVAHIHTCSGFTFFLDGVLISLAKLHRVPVVVHIHGGLFHQFYDNSHPFLQKLIRWLFGLCDRVVVLSDSWQHELKKRLGIHHFCVVPNGVPISEDSPKQPSPDNKVNVLFLGNLSTMKGVFDLLAVMPYVDNALLHLVGAPENPADASEIDRLLKEKRLIDRVKLHGIKSGSDKQRLLRDADIFVLPSYAEGLPMSLLEAMACGLPIIASSVGAIPTVINQEIEGLLITAGDQEQLAAVLNRLVDDAELRNKMGRAAKLRCRAEFGLDNTVDKLLRMYRELQAEPQNAR